MMKHFLALAAFAPSFAFALAIDSPRIGDFWRPYQNWFPTTSSCSPGSDTFDYRTHTALDAQAAADFYSVLDGYDQRAWVFSNGSSSPSVNTVSSKALIDYGELISRKASLRNCHCFGNGSTIFAGGQALDQWMADNGYATFTGFGWRSQPFENPATDLSCTWFPCFRLLSGDGDIFTGGAVYGGVAMAAWRTCAFDFDDETWRGHTWEYDSLGGTAAVGYNDFLANAYTNLWLTEMTSTVYTLRWKPVEMAAKCLAPVDRMFVVSGDLSSAMPSAIALNASVTYTGSNTTDRIYFNAETLDAYDTGSGAISIGSLSMSTNLVQRSVAPSNSASFFQVSPVAANAWVMGSKVVGSTGFDPDDWKDFVRMWFTLQGITSNEVYSTFSLEQGLYVTFFIGEEQYNYTEPVQTVITEPTGRITIDIVGSAKASYSAFDNTCVTTGDDAYPIALALSNYVSRVDLYAFVSTTSTVGDVEFACTRYQNVGIDGYASTLAQNTSAVTSRIKQYVDNDFYDPRGYSGFSSSDATASLNACSNLSVTITRTGSGERLCTAIVALDSEYNPLIVSREFASGGQICVNVEASHEGGAIAQRFDASSRRAWVTDARLDMGAIRQTSNGRRVGQ